MFQFIVDLIYYIKGDELYMVGHAVFGKERHLSSSVSRGVLSKVVKHRGLPVMIQVSPVTRHITAVLLTI